MLKTTLLVEITHDGKVTDRALRCGLERGLARLGDESDGGPVCDSDLNAHLFSFCVSIKEENVITLADGSKMKVTIPENDKRG